MSRAGARREHAVQQLLDAHACARAAGRARTPRRPRRRAPRGGRARCRRSAGRRRAARAGTAPPAAAPRLAAGSAVLAHAARRRGRAGGRARRRAAPALMRWRSGPEKPAARTALARNMIASRKRRAPVEWCGRGSARRVVGATTLRARRASVRVVDRVEPGGVVGAREQQREQFAQVGGLRRQRQQRARSRWPSSPTKVGARREAEVGQQRGGVDLAPEAASRPATLLPVFGVAVEHVEQVAQAQHRRRRRSRRARRPAARGAATPSGGPARGGARPAARCRVGARCSSAVRSQADAGAPCARGAGRAQCSAEAQRQAELAAPARRSARRLRSCRRSCRASCRCGVARRVQLVYSKVSPGLSSGCWPTTPRPRTSSTWPLASVMIQWRAISCAGHVAGVADRDRVGEGVLARVRVRLLGQVAHARRCMRELGSGHAPITRRRCAQDAS